MKILFKVLAVLALLLGVALLFLPPDDRRRIIPFWGGINKSAYQPFADVIGKSEKILLFEGVPRLLPTPDPEQHEISKNGTFTSHGAYFRQAEIIPSPGDAAALKLLAMSSDTFSKRGGSKKCGGFHPDWLIRWTGPDGAACELQVCFGCHEAKIYRAGSELYCDIHSQTYGLLREILQKYARQHSRPSDV